MFGGPPRPETGLFAIVTLPNGEQVMHPVPQGASDGDIRGLFAADMAQHGINSQEQAVQRPGMFGGREQYWLNALKGQGNLEAPERTLSSVMQDAIAALGGNTRYSNHLADKATGFLSDLTPVGDAVSADDARQAWKRGDKLSALGNAALAALGSVPGAGDITAKAIRGYHGHVDPFDQFDPAMSNGRYFFSDNPEVARQYGYRVKEADLNFKNPLIVPRLSDPSHIDPLVEKAKAAGHDGLIVESIDDVGGPQRQFIAFEPPELRPTNWR